MGNILCLPATKTKNPHFFFFLTISTDTGDCMTRIDHPNDGWLPKKVGGKHTHQQHQTLPKVFDWWLLLLLPPRCLHFTSVCQTGNLNACLPATSMCNTQQQASRLSCFWVPTRLCAHMEAGMALNSHLSSRLRLLSHRWGL